MSGKSMHFSDSRLRMMRAQEHITEFSLLISNFWQNNPLKVEVRRNISGVGFIHFAVFPAGIESRVKVVAADALANLRSALDLLNTECSRLAGTHDPAALRKLHFPFDGSEENWKKALKSKCHGVPSEVLDYFATLKPFAGGDAFLYGLTGARNDCEHWALTQTIITILAFQVGWNHGRREVLDIPGFQLGTCGEVELFRTHHHTTDYHVSALIMTRFSDVPQYKGMEPIRVLSMLHDQISTIITKTEEIMQNIGLIA